MSFRILSAVTLLSGICLAPFSLTGCGSEGQAEFPVHEVRSPSRAAEFDQVESKLTEADRLVRSATARIELKQIAQAVENLNAAIRLDAEHAEAYFQRAGIRADTGQDADALADYEKAIALAPSDTRFLNMKGLFLLTRQQYDQAEQEFTRAIQIDPDFTKAYNNRGLVGLSRSDFVTAARDFQQAISIDPQYVDAHNNLGFARYQSGEYGQALRAFNQALELSPQYVNAYSNRGMLLMKTEEFKQAAADFTKAIELDAGNEQHYRLRIAAWRALGREELAAADEQRMNWVRQLARIETRIRNAPDSAQGHIQRASHLARGGHTEVALTSFEKALELSPGNSEALTKRAEFWLQQGDARRAIADCNAALNSLNARGEFSYQSISVRGDAWLLLGRFDEAISDFTAARRFDVTVAEAYYQRAVLRESQGDQPGAESDLATAEKIHPGIGQRDQ